jgi:hypothetical protein
VPPNSPESSQQGRSAGTAAFLRQRFVHGRAHGKKRGARFGIARNAAGVVGAPIVPQLLSWRILRTVVAKRRHRRHALVALPFILLFNVAWSAGEHLDALRSR